MSRHVERVEHLEGTIKVPGDKSASHRALMLSALAAGESSIEGLSSGHDVAATSQIMVQLGAERHDEGARAYVVGPPDGLRASDQVLQCANSGTTIRLVSGIVSGIEGRHRLEGDASLSRRPMDRVAIPLGLMGAQVIGQGERVTAPLEILGASTLHGIDYQVPTPSAQVKSAILLAGLFAVGSTTVREALRTRSATEDMLRAAGVDVASRDEGAGRVVTLTPSRPAPQHWRVPSDPSQAAFFCVLAAIHPDADITVVEVEDSPERIGFVNVLRRMGADLERQSSEAGSTLRVRSSLLSATEVHAAEIPSVDEVPILTVAAAAATGVSAFRDMGELRLKESDRFAGALRLAQALGCRVWSEGDDFFVEGLGSSRRFENFSFDAGLDHRFVMSSAVAGAAGQGCDIIGADTVASSYPQFFDHLASLR